MRAKFGSDPTAGSKKLSFKFISRLTLFTHRKSGPAQINVGRPRLYFVFTQHSVWAGLHRYVSALAVRPAQILYCIYTQLLRTLYIFTNYTHDRGRTSDLCFSRQMYWDVTLIK